MNKGILVSTAIGLVLAGSRASAQNSDADAWAGPGYYYEAIGTSKDDGTQFLDYRGGPFASLDACQAYWRQNPPPPPGPDDLETYSFQCAYRESDPNYVSCFLTTACVRHARLPDDCEELTVMRAFRDSYLNRFEEGRLLIDQYYRIAPRIVECIRRSPGRDKALGWILREVRETARAIGRGEPDVAIARYAVMVRRLQERYGVTDNGGLLLANT